jgi:hypothetical protein
VTSAKEHGTRGRAHQPLHHRRVQSILLPDIANDNGDSAGMSSRLPRHRRRAICRLAPATFANGEQHHFLPVSDLCKIPNSIGVPRCAASKQKPQFRYGLMPLLLDAPQRQPSGPCRSVQGRSPLLRQANRGTASSSRIGVKWRRAVAERIVECRIQPAPAGRLRFLNFGVFWRDRHGR